MKVVTAIDSFKGSLTSLDAGKACANGIRRVYPDADVIIRPLADGGEGTTEALALGMNGRLRTVSVHDARMRKTDCTYCIAGNTAVIEMAVAAGLPQLEPELRDPLETTTYGVGELIADAINEGCRDFVIGIGGSATNDGGTGMLAALGFGLLDKNGNPIALGAKGLRDLVKIDDSDVIPGLRDCRVRVACDVTNPLCGELGCSAVYGPQKGATPETVREMDGWLENFAKVTKEKYPTSDMNYPGSGAAGGLGFALREFLGGELISGISLVLDVTRLEDYIKDADIVITGEGRLDRQSAMGKAPVGVAKLAKKYGKLCIAFSGAVTEDAVACNEVGIDAFFPIRRKIDTLDEAMDTKNASRDLSDTAEQVFRLIKSCGQI
ncbi:MAG: glycerate kinase [Clostridia bacterium]|nr:glycerate kinase [Clostridia bacterium]